MALPRALDKLLPPKTEHDPAHDPVAFHPQYQYHPNQPMLDQAMLIAVHSVDGVKHPVHDMGFYYSRGVLRQAS